eukprot:gene11900-8184_t
MLLAVSVFVICHDKVLLLAITIFDGDGAEERETGKNNNKDIEARYIYLSICTYIQLDLVNPSWHSYLLRAAGQRRLRTSRHRPAAPNCCVPQKKNRGVIHLFYFIITIICLFSRWIQLACKREEKTPFYILLSLSSLRTSSHFHSSCGSIFVPTGRFTCKCVGLLFGVPPISFFVFCSCPTHASLGIAYAHAHLRLTVVHSLCSYYLFFIIIFSLFNTIIESDDADCLFPIEKALFFGFYHILLFILFSML